MNHILKTYFAVADIIAGTFGQNCEVVVHDLTQPESSVVYVANGSVTNRQVGQSFNHLVKKVLLNKKFKNDRAINYSFATADNRQIKSSSALIRDQQDKVIGMICINCDITVYMKMQEQLNFLINTDKDIQNFQEEDVGSDVTSIIDDLIAKIIGTADVKNLTRKKCVEIVKFMDEKGIFLVRGTMDKVADIMGVSKVTVYSYLDEAKGKRQ